MKTYNKKVLESNKRVIQSTRKASHDIIQTSMKTVDKLTHPPQKIACIGSVIGGSIGAGLVLTGVRGIILGRSLWASGTIITGAVIITSNVINLKRNKE